MAKNKKKSKTKINQASSEEKPQSQDSIPKSQETEQANVSKINVSTKVEVKDDETRTKNLREEAEMHTKRFPQNDRKGQNGGSNQRNYPGPSNNWRQDSNTYKSNGSDNRNVRKDNTYTRKSEPFKRTNEEDRGDKKRHSLNVKRESSDSRRRKSRWDEEDPEFVLYKEEFDDHHGEIEYKKTKEIVSNLFTMPEAFSLAHCVAEDMNMGSGIAVQFRRDFRRVDELLNQRQKKGGLAILKDKDRYIYYLVTKTYSTGKPTNATLFSSLKQLRSHVVENEVTKLAMPRIGCGLDRLDWDEVKFMIEFVFRDVEVEIVICNLEPTEDSFQQRHKNCRVTNETYPIQTIEAGTLIVYFSSEDEHVSDDMKALDEKFHFLREFRMARKSLGRVVFYSRVAEFVLCGCIVRKSQKDPFDFVALQNCLIEIQKENKKHRLEYIAFQAMKDEDSCINYKIINIMRNKMRDVEVYVCWPEGVQDEMTAKDRFGDYGKRASFNQGQDKRETYGKSDWRTKNDSFLSTDSALSGGTSDYSLQNNSLTEKTDESRQNTSFESSTSKETEPLNDSFWFDDDANRTSLRMEMGNSNPDKNLTPVGTQNVDDNWDQPELQTQNTVPSLDHRKGSASEVNHEFETFELDFKSKSIECSLVKEQDTPDLPKQYSRVCYAREDLITESGVPFGSELSQHLGKLLQQGRKEGSVAIVREENNYLYCLIIKGPTTSATPQSVFSAIQQLRDHASLNRVKKLVIPKMDTGDASFDWSTVKYMFQFLLGKRNIEMTIAPFPNVYNVESLNERYKNKIVHSKCSIHQMKKKSVIIYLTSADGHISEEMLGLGKKFDFTVEYCKRRKFLGDVIPFKQNEDHVLMGCIVKTRHTDPIDFESLWKCVSAVNARNKNEKLPHVGIQAVTDQIDASVNFKIATVLYNNLEDVTITMCWPGSLRGSMPQNKS